MLTPLQYEEKELAAFDSFAKSVIRNTGRNIVNAEKRKNKEVLVDSDVDEHSFDTYIREESFSKYVITDRNGHSCDLTDKFLYDAVLLLTEGQKEVLIMEFWYGMKQSEIATKLKITSRAVSLRKKNAFESIRKNYKGDYNGQN